MRGRKATMKISHTIDSLLATLAPTTDGIDWPKEIRSFYAKYPAVMVKETNYTEDGDPCGLRASKIEDSIGYLACVVEQFEDMVASAEYWRERAHPWANDPEAIIHGWHGEVFQDTRIRHLTADSVARRQRAAEFARIEDANAEINRLGLTEDIGSVEWFSAIEANIRWAYEDSSNEETRIERYLTSRACGQSQEGYYSDEDDIRSHPSRLAEAFRLMQTYMPIQYGRWLESRQKRA